LRIRLGDTGGDREFGAMFPRWPVTRRLHRPIEQHQLAQDNNNRSSLSHAGAAFVQRGATNSTAIARDIVYRRGPEPRSLSRSQARRTQTSAGEAMSHALTEGNFDGRNARWGDHDHRRSPIHSIACAHHRMIPTPEYTPTGRRLRVGSRPPMPRSPAKWPATPGVAPHGSQK
jgi:hypothetical protein